MAAWWIGLALAVPVQAQEGLRQAFEAAWARQPEAQSLAQRRAAGAASAQAARAWTAEPMALEGSIKTDRFTAHEGSREWVAGVSASLWLPGERARSQALAAAEEEALDGHMAAAQWRTAGAVRETWWAAHGARIEAATAQERLAHARQLAADVARRVQAGDLSRADQHQADMAVAATQAEAATATAAQMQALQGLRALTGLMAAEPGPGAAEPEPGGDPEPLLAAHPLLRELSHQAEVAHRARELAGLQSRANPELALQLTRERGAFGERYGQSLTVGVRLPLPGGSRHQARVAHAAAEQIEADARRANEQQRLAAEAQAAAARLAGARLGAEAAGRRAALATETRGFYDKAFRLGQADLPTRLRIELDAAEAERQAAQARIALAQALSSVRQALGLMPQ